MKFRSKIRHFRAHRLVLHLAAQSGATSSILSFTVGGQDVFGKALEFSAEQEAFATSIVTLREHGRQTIMTIPVIPSRHHIVDVHLSRLVMDFCWAASRHTRQPLEVTNRCHRRGGLAAMVRSTLIDSL